MFKRIKRHLNSKKLQKDTTTFTGEVFGDIVYTNNYIDIIHDACKICYKSKHEETQEGKLEYIAKRIATGHESILEHSNIISYYVFDNDLAKELSEVLIYCNYLRTNIKYTEDNRTMLIIAGSIRGYKHIIKNITDPYNKIYYAIVNNMYRIEKEFFGDLIKDNILTEPNFYSDNIEGIQKYTEYKFNNPEILNYDICGYSDTNVIDFLMNEAFSILLSRREVMELLTITIKFKDVSRIISQQYTRHRAAITQESQRYVDYSNSTFNSPAKFKEEYPYDKKYDIILNGVAKEMTMGEIGNEEISIYHQMKAQGLKKEDCRAFLPNNTTTTFYMTFTYTGFTKFLELRTNSGAQAEIRQTAELLLDIFLNILNIDNVNDLFNEVLTPYYTWINNNDMQYRNIDEIVK